MAGPETVGDFRIIFGALIGIFDQQADRRAGGFTFKHAGENFDFVGFPALRGMPRGAGFAPVKIDLQIGFAQGQARRATVDNAPNGRAVAFAESGDGK